MNTVLIKNAKIVNEGTIFEGDVLIENEFIVEIAERKQLCFVSELRCRN